MMSENRIKAPVSVGAFCYDVGMKLNFWQTIQKLVDDSEIHIDRPKGSAHPRYEDYIYPFDYGHLVGTTSADGDGIDCWVGPLGGTEVTGVITVVDPVKKDSEIKILIGCSGFDAELIMNCHRRGDMQAILKMKVTHIFEGIEVRNSEIEGKGIFAIRDFKQGERVVEWDRKELTEEEYQALSAEDIERYVSLKEGKHLLSMEPMRYVNHSCNPNTQPIDNGDVAIRDIKAGEEITSSYLDKKTTCNCGEEYCIEEKNAI